MGTCTGKSDFVRKKRGGQFAHIEVEDRGVNVRRIGVVDRVRRPRKDDTLGLEVKILDLLGAREHLRVDIELTETTSDQMAVLGSVDNGDE